MIHCVDYETYYDDECSVKVLGVEAYCRHPQFKAYLVSIVGDTLTYVGPPEDAPWDQIKDGLFVSHNARFDQEVHRWLKLPMPTEWQCTADLASWLKAPRDLKGASEMLLQSKMSKEVRGRMKGVTYAEAIQRGWMQELHDYALVDAEKSYQIWMKYADTWPVSERALSSLNRAWGHRGIKIHRTLAEQYGSLLTKSLWEAAQLIPWSWPPDETPLKASKFKEYCRGLGLWVPKSMSEDSEECAQWEAEYGEKYPVVGALRSWRKANILLKKIETILRRLDEADNFAWDMFYFGAHTGRFSGAGGFNLQNLPKEPYCGVDLRRLIVPAEGKKILMADLAQIEARVVLWLAGSKNMLRMIEEGHNLYEAHARLTMGWTGGSLKKENPKLYALAKARCLGLGFGAGPAKFQILAKMYDIDLTLEESKKCVYDFRDSNPEIVALWNENQKLATWSALNQEDYEVTLPSGRIMSYSRMARDSDGLTACHGYSKNRYKTYGANIVENLVQATARDYFVDRMLALHEAGHKVLFHVHDEVVLEVAPDVDCQEIERILLTKPEWAKGLPVGVEIAIADHYKK